MSWPRGDFRATRKVPGGPPVGPAASDNNEYRQLHDRYGARIQFTGSKMPVGQAQAFGLSLCVDFAGCGSW